MDSTHATDAMTVGDVAAALRGYVPPSVDLGAHTREELRAWFGAADVDLEQCERVLAMACRARGAIDVAIAEGLDALRLGDRLAVLAFHLDDYAREVLDLRDRGAQSLARLGRELRTRSLLREAMRAGKVRLRAAQTILNVAVGEREAEWVERAARMTVRALEEAVRQAGSDPGEDEEWLRLGVVLRPEERAVVDEALALAGETDPGKSRMERLEAMCQEFLAEYGGDPDEDEKRPLEPAFREIGPGCPPAPPSTALRMSGREALRRAELEAETERWSALEAVMDWTAPDVRFYETATAEHIDARLRELAALRAGWDDLVGFCAYLVKRSRLPEVLGFASFAHYVEERLGIPARAVEQRAALEKRLRASPALREARRQKVSYEKLRLLARLPEKEIASWTPRARALTVIALERKLRAERERQMRAVGKLAVSMPRRIAVLLAAAIQAVCDRSDHVVSTGKCLAIIAGHFLETWKELANPRKSRSRKVRERDGHHCQVPGCSHRGTQSHHVAFKSRGGGDEPENQVGICAFHHLRCIHGGYLRVEGRAPDALTWLRGGEPWAGR